MGKKFGETVKEKENTIIFNLFFFFDHAESSAVRERRGPNTEKPSSGVPSPNDVRLTLGIIVSGDTGPDPYWGIYGGATVDEDVRVATGPELDKHDVPDHVVRLGGPRPDHPEQVPGGGVVVDTEGR